MVDHRRIEALVELGRHAQARELVTAALAESPDDRDLHGLHARALLGLGDPDAALRAGNRVVALAPDDEWGHRLCSVALDHLGQLQEAARAAAEAVRLAPHAWQTHQRYAAASLRLPGGQLEAHAAAMRAVELAPNEPEAHFTVGLVAQHRSDHDIARAAYQRTLALDPTHAQALNNLTVLEGSLRLGRAARGFAGALRHDAQDDTARQNLKGLLVSFLFRLYLFGLACFVTGLLVVRATDGPGPASLVVLACYLLGATAYGVLTWRHVPTGVRLYLRSQLRSGMVLWNLLVVALMTALVVAVCLVPGSWTVAVVLLRPLLLGLVISSAFVLAKRFA